MNVTLDNLKAASERALALNDSPNASQTAVLNAALDVLNHAHPPLILALISIAERALLGCGSGDVRCECALCEAAAFADAALNMPSHWIPQTYRPPEGGALDK